MLNPKQALRGLHILAILALTSCAALAAGSMSSTGAGFTGPFNPIAPDGTFFANGWRFENFGGLNPFTTVPAELSYSLSPDKQTLTLVVKSPAGTASAGKSLNSFSYVSSDFFTGLGLPPGPLSYDWSVVFSENVVEGELGFPQSSYDSGTRNEAYDGGVPYTGHVDSVDNRGLVTFSGWTPTSDNVVTCTITITNLVWTANTTPIHTVVLNKGDVVPGIPDATFTSLGVPAVSAEGLFAVLGKWKSPTGSGAGIFSRGALVAKVGDEVQPGSGVTIKALKDPVITTLGLVTFPATLTGTGITPLNDAAILSNAPGGTLAIVAQEGTQVPDAPAGALWKSFSSVAAPDGGGGALILGFMQQDVGGITKTNDSGIWASDETGALHLVLQEGTTQIGGKTVKSFKALKTSSGTPGQAHAFNARTELTAKVTFTDGFQAVVKLQPVKTDLLPNSGFTDGVDGLNGWTTTLNPPGTSTCCSPSPDFFVTGPGTVEGPFDGGGPYNIDFNRPITLSGNVYQTASLKFTWAVTAFESPGIGFSGDRTFAVQVVNASNVVVATLFSVTVGGYDTTNGPAGGTEDIDVAATLNGLPAGDYTFRFDSFIPSYYSGPAEMHISDLSLVATAPGFEAETPSVPTVLYTKGDAVPSVAGATFTGFGVPAINDGGHIAYLGKWKSPTGSGAGIFVNNLLVAKVGDDVSFGAGVLLKSLKDPVLDADGHVAFPAALKGAGITPANDAALISNQFGTAAIVAEEGTQPIEAAPGALYKSFNSVALPGGGQGPLFLGALANGSGGITSATNQGLWSTDPNGGQHLVLQAGATVIDGKTVKSFKVLKSVSGTPGQTHAFNGSWHVLSLVTFSDGSKATLDTLLPGGANISATLR